MEEEIDLLELFNIFWRKKFIIAFVVLIFCMVGAVYSLNYKIPLYKSQARVLLTQNNMANSNEEITQTDIILNQQLVSTYGELIKSKNIINQVLKNLEIQTDFEEIRKNIEVTAVEDTQVIEIVFVNEDAEVSFKIANELVTVFAEKVKEIYNISNVYIVDTPELAEEPYNMNYKKDILIFGVVGIISSCLIIFIFSLLDTTVKSVEEVEKVTGLNVLGQLPETKIEKERKEIIAHEDPKSPITEVFKTIRTNLQFTKTKSEASTILITSTMPGEGKSWVTSNLGVAFAQSNKKVVIIDSDMRKGRLHNVFGVNIFPGLSNYLTENEKSIKDYCMKTEIDNLWIIPTGNVPQNPSELLSNERMVRGLEELKANFDIIIFDSTPCMLVTDAVIISRIVNTTIIVSAYKATRMENLKSVQRSIENVGGNIAGVLINRIPISLKKYKSKYYYYGERDKKTLESHKRNVSENEIKVCKKSVDNKKILESSIKNDTIINQIDEFLSKHEL